MGERPDEGRIHGGRAVALPGTALLKSNGRRSVLRAVRGETLRLLKVYHSSGTAALLDGHRARRELAAGRALMGAGIPVPEPLRVEQVDGRPALVQECLEPAWTLAQALERGRPRRVRALGATAELLARMEHAGCTHPDLHPGNVLLARDERAALLIDVRGARVGRRSPRAFDAQLAHVGATLRDRTPRAWAVLRGRFDRSSVTERDAERWSRIEDEARRRRLDMTHRRLRVWRRESAETEVAEEAGARVVRVRPGRAPGGGSKERVQGSRAELDAAWRTLTLAAMHALPAARPVALALDGPPWLDCARPGRLAEERPAAEAPPELRALLGDRGLRLEGTVEIGGDGAAWIGPGGRLVRVL